MKANLFTPVDGPRVYNMSAGTHFLDELAKGLTESLGNRLADALILLPTRRAVRELGEAFIRVQSARRAALLPMMRPLADVAPDEPPFEPGDLAHLITPSIDPVRRKFELSKLVLAKEARLRDSAPDAAAALALTEPVLALLDDCAMEELSPEDISKLDDIIDRSSQHYQHAAIFYKIVQDYWPKFLDDPKTPLMDPMQRRVALLNALTDLWSETPPDHPVIIAGSTGTLGATARLMSVVSRLKDGLIVLPGLDTHIYDAGVWEEMEDAHPQASLKRLLGTIGIERSAVKLWPGQSGVSRAAPRRTLIAESLIPAQATAGWIDRIEAIRTSIPGVDVFNAALDGLSLVEARTQDEEAAIIALAMRHTVLDPEKTAALVTPDPALGRRVKAKLTRWNIDVDVSAGEPLEETPAGAYLSWIARAAADPWDPIALAAIFKHKLSALGRRPSECTQLWRDIEHAGFRGVRPKSIEDLQNRRGVKRGDFTDAIALIVDLHSALEPLTRAQSLSLSPKEFARLHCHVAEDIARTDNQSGAERLWRAEDGETAAKLMADLLSYGDILPDGDGPAYSALLTSLMQSRVVRPKYGTHPHLSILGPLEARMLSADLVILGGLNEGIWPAPPPVDSLLSYGMRAELNLSSPERRIGLSAHDFAQLAAHKNVVLTRSEKSDDGQAVASRWIWRLKTLIQGALGSEEAMQTALKLPDDQRFDLWASALDHVSADQVQPAREPKPSPPQDQRWPRGRELPVTQIEKWVRDPYSIFAGRILRLRPLDPLDQAIGPREYGSALHDAMESFVERYPAHIGENAKDWLEAEFTSKLLAAGYPPSAMASEAVRLSALADWVVNFETERRAMGIFPKGVEVSGRLNIQTQSGEPFTVTAKADRIDKGLGGYSLIDYKTGKPPTEAQLTAGFSPQLPLEAAILEVSGFGEKEDGKPIKITVPAGTPDDLLYIRLMGRAQGSFAKSVSQKTSAQELGAMAYQGLQELIDLFDAPDAVYRSQPRAENVNPYGDFDHLARRAEWASASDDDGGSE